MKEKYLLLKVIDPRALDLAFIRSLLNNLIYIEIDNLFIISSTKSFKDQLARELNSNDIFFILVLVNEKTGGDVKSRGVNREDFDMIKNIVLDND